MFFYNGHNSESEGGCENDDNDDGGDVFFLPWCRRGPLN